MAESRLEAKRTNYLERCAKARKHGDWGRVRLFKEGVIRDLDGMINRLESRQTANKVESSK